MRSSIKTGMSAQRTRPSDMASNRPITFEDEKSRSPGNKIVEYQTHSHALTHTHTHTHKTHNLYKGWSEE